MRGKLVELNSPAEQADKPNSAGHRSRLRALPATFVLGVVVPVVGGIVAIASQLDAAKWIAVALAIVATAVAVALAAAKWRSESVVKKTAEEQKRREQATAETKWLHAVQECMLWPIPRIGDVDPYTQLGVAPPHLTGQRAADREAATPYVDRDIDPAARRQLQANGFVLLLGAPCSGVTRTAYQLALTVPTSPRVFAPIVPHGVSTALGELDVLSRPELRVNLLLWLDRIDTFTKHGLTATMLRRFGQRSPGLRVVATISTNQYEVWAAENPALAEVFGDPIPLARMLSPKEAECAQATYPDVDFSEGLAPAFTNTTTLLRRLRGGNHDCPYDPTADQCALAGVIIEIALEWAGTGIGRPLPVDRLITLAQQRSGGRQGSHHSHLASALEWATSPVIGGASLLLLTTDIEGEQHVAAHPAIVEIWKTETSGPQQPVWTAAVEQAEAANDSEALGCIGFRAHTSANPTAAAHAWQMVTNIDDAAAHWLVQAAEFSRRRGEHAEEIVLRDQILQLTEAADSPDDLAVAVALTASGNAWFDLGQPGKALERHERALLLLEAAYDPKHRQVAVALTNVANAWGELGQPGKALKLYERALPIIDEVAGANHPQTVAVLIGLGSTWGELGQPDKAIELLEPVLPVAADAFGADHPEVAAVLTSLGNAWFTLGQPDKACELFDRALPIFEAAYPPNHPKVATVLTNLGGAWLELEQPAKALPMLERALPIAQANYGNGHQRVAVVLTNLGGALLRLKQPANAYKRYEQALSITETTNHAGITTALIGMGTALLRLGQPAKARRHYERALSIRKEALGADHPEVATVLPHLGTALFLLGQPAKARGLYEQASYILHAKLPGGHPKIKSLKQGLRQIDPDVIVLENGKIIWSPRETE